MKKSIVFLLGMLTGAVLTFIILAVIGTASGATSDNGVTNYDQPREYVETKSFKVLQVLDDNAALVTGGEKLFDDEFIYSGPVYLMRNDKGKYYYDDEVISVPSNKVLRYTGTYKYEAKSGMHKTVGIIEIMDK